MQLANMPLGCHVFHMGSDIMAVWVNVVVTCPHHAETTCLVCNETRSNCVVCSLLYL